MRARIVLGLLLAGVLARTAAADDARAQFRLDGGRPHVGVPFQLDLVLEGFDESPAPDQPKLTIPDANVTALGAQPNVSRSIQIINGRRTDSTRVTWVLHWRVEVHKDGTLRVPATTVTQGTKHATAAAGEVEVEAVPTSDDMKLTLDLPSRPVFVGETVPVTMTWLFRRQPQDQTFSVPLLGMDAFTVSGPAVTNPRRALQLSAGAKDLQLPYTVDQTTINGVEYNRLAVTFFAAPRTIPPGGKVEVPPATVVAGLAVGRADFFGNAPTKMFRATDVARTLEVKALPETDRPAVFSGAVGDQFSIEVRTSRSVVQLGEPVELDVKIKSNQPLDTLSLGKLDGEGRLPKDKFTVPADPPTGELTDDGKTKTFKITAQVTGPATVVPALSFAYFDPAKGQYTTIKSEPIALSVKGGSFVGANDVVSGAPTKRGSGAAPAHTDDSALVNADLALSSIGATNDTPLSGGLLWLLIGLLYAVPIAVLAGRSWQLRTRGQREEAAEVRAARRKVEDLLDRAAHAPARDIAGPLADALRDLARVMGRAVDDAGLLAKLETESFSQSSALVPLSNDLRSNAAGLMRRWLGEARKSPSKKAAAAAIVLIALAAPSAHASPLDDGRAAYQEAMEVNANASVRKAAFARAELSFGEAVRATPDRPELLADWGNAALGAGDVATATLAYRRTLVLDPDNARARKNLGWLHTRQVEMFRPAAAGATDTLLFFHSWPRPKKLVVGSAAFALAILLFVPWAGRRRRGLTGVAILPLAIWVAMIASVVLEDSHGDDAVVMDDVVMRAADSAGAPAALSQPLPRGTEVTVLERRDSWTRIRISNGTAGWVPDGAVERIAR
jgi:hypothetical protein